MSIFHYAAYFVFFGSLFAQNTQPNIIVLFADDQRADTIGAHGNSYIRTPNLDKLAAEGVSFRRNFCAGSFSGAVCVASRAMLMTGRHWKQIKTKSPGGDWSDLPLLPSYLKDKAGYNTFIVGKWHNGLATLRSAFSDGASVYMGGMCDHTDFLVLDYAKGKLSEKRKAKEFSSTEFANAAINYIEQAKTDKPFFLYVAFTAPHDPRNPPEKYREIYYKNRVPLPKNFKAEHPFENAPMSNQGRDEGLAPWPRTKAMISDQLCEYYGLITHLDEQVGRIVKAVKESVHADNTIIIYTADHGLAMGSHGLLGKQNIYEQSMSSPMIISGKGIPQGEANFSYTYIHDLYATICAFAGIELPQGVTSQSLVPLINGDKPQIRDSIFLPFQDNQRAVSDGKWKLHIYPKINHTFLFDIENDPDEMRDLSQSNPEKVEQLRKLMETWRTEVGDSDPLQVANPEPKQATYSNSKRVLDAWQPKWIRDKYFEGRQRSNHGRKK
ncbi:sulfatase-like hydrolase/transferase [Lentisphaera profundi]|uniref:Sulfatase-like hydrolase/transferase n=1 Tax=Lentisphaera profundi TaxID=1658616 RepID=A0ABY7VYQ8_9BACT|nr:sulfatase-like hydrolase/transferase [Lentisphaera profundi]WDE99380.1 sulfatase-like hydrolase/transferase [Lentisphaera profundi]